MVFTGFKAGVGKFGNTGIRIVEVWKLLYNKQKPIDWVLSDT